MRDAQYPKPVSEVLATLTDLFRHQHNVEIVELLENAHSYFDTIEFDNWNGGTYTWALRLEVAVPVFASAELRLSEIEGTILNKLSHYNRLYPNDPIGAVTVSPITPGSMALGQRLAPSELEVQRLWPAGRFRLFLSHVSQHQAAVSLLKNELSSLGIAAFVAHKDVEPSREWQDEIELALRSMHALAALLTADFHSSQWTDHEVGWALGRGVLVLPVRLGVNPYGFFSKYQGLSGSLDQPAVLAEAFLEALLRNPQTHAEMRRSLVGAFRNSTSFIMSITLKKHLSGIADLTEEEKAALVLACKENHQVKEAFGVPSSIFKLCGIPQEQKPTERAEDEIPF